MPERPVVALARNLHDDVTRLRTLKATPSLATLDGWMEQLASALQREEEAWLSEERARRRSNHAVAWLRRKFPRWERSGFGRWRDGKREYHEAVIEAGRFEPVTTSARQQARLDAAA